MSFDALEGGGERVNFVGVFDTKEAADEEASEKNWGHWGDRKVFETEINKTDQWLM